MRHNYPFWRRWCGCCHSKKKIGMIPIAQFHKLWWFWGISEKSSSSNDWLASIAQKSQFKVNKINMHRTIVSMQCRLFLCCDAGAVTVPNEILSYWPNMNKRKTRKKQNQHHRRNGKATIEFAWIYHLWDNQWRPRDNSHSSLGSHCECEQSIHYFK